MTGKGGLFLRLTCYLLLTLPRTDSLGIKNITFSLFSYQRTKILQNMPLRTFPKRVERNTNQRPPLPFSRRPCQIRRRCGATKNHPPHRPSPPSLPVHPFIRSFMHVLALAKLSLSDHTSAPLELDPIADLSASPSHPPRSSHPPSSLFLFLFLLSRPSLRSRAVRDRLRTVLEKKERREKGAQGYAGV